VVQVDRCGRSSVVTRALATSPLRILTPRNHGDAAWLYLGSYGGGLLDGDAQQIGVRVAPAARALISTQAWTKVFRAGNGSTVGARVTVEAAVGTGGHLFILPDPVVCFASSRYEQIQRIDLEENAGLVLVDWVTGGRRASGERWQFARYASRLAVRYAGRPVFLDACLLTPVEGPLPERLGRFNVLGLIAIVGPPFLVPARDTLARFSGRPLERRSSLLAAASAIGEVGVQVRLAGESVEEVGAAVRDILQFVVPLLGDDPWARKW
jgi:urease accessory protein